MNNDKTFPMGDRVGYHPDSYPSDKERGFPPTKLNRDNLHLNFYPLIRFG